MAPRLYLSRSLLRWKLVLPSQIIEHIVIYPFLPSSFIMLVGFVGGILTRHPTDSVSLLSRSPSFTVIIWATCLVRRLKLLNLNRSYGATSSIIVVFSCMWSKVWKRRTKSSVLQQHFPHLLSFPGVVSFLIFSSTLNFRDASPMQHWVALQCILNGSWSRLPYYTLYQSPNVLLRILFKEGRKKLINGKRWFVRCLMTESNDVISLISNNSIRPMHGSRKSRMITSE